VKYYVTVGDQRIELELGPEGVVFEGEGALSAELATVPGSSLRHLLLGDAGWPLVTRRQESGWVITAGGRRFHVQVEDERTHSIRELAGLGAPADGPTELRAPMPGLVVRLLVETGQDVDRGDGLVVMEAMKMENELRADVAGRVAEIRVQEGATVAQGDVLVVLEAGEET